MSCGKPDDWENTKKQLISPNPVSNNETWLGHRLEKKDGTPYQAARIDLMVLAGRYTVDEMAKKNNISLKRAEDHLEHLQDGDSRNRNSAMKPHKLKIIKDTNGIVRFASDMPSNYNCTDYFINGDKNSHLPTREDFESAYRMLARPGDSIQIDSVLNQIEVNARKNLVLLKNNWRIITEKNIEDWSKKG